MPKWKIVEAPSPEISRDECAITLILAFSDGNYWHWCASDPSYIVTQTVDDIPERRLFKTRRWIKRCEVDRRMKAVCAVLNGKVIGYSTWIKPINLAKKQSWMQCLCRRALEVKDRMADRMFPTFWIDKERVTELEKTQKAMNDRYFGADGTDYCWELLELAILPDFQRQGVGGTLVEWGKEEAQKTGTGVCLYASRLGKGLYEKKGFTVLDKLHLEEGDSYLNEWLMVWKPEVAEDGDKSEQGKC